jgi:formylglycine-generating enzyme required for sulfatase activity
LPTDAEWEFACRAGTETAFHNGSNDSSTIGSIAWFVSNSDNQTHVVGGKQPNQLGFYDMSGNVWEMVSDWWGLYSPGPQTNPMGPINGDKRMGRGGSFAYAVEGITVMSSSRSFDTADARDAIAGLRVARNP